MSLIDSYPHPSKPYTEIPTFVVDENHSAYEGETMHKVGRLFRGDYHIDWALELMGGLIVKFLKNAEQSGFVRDEIRARLDAEIAKRLQP